MITKCKSKILIAILAIQVLSGCGTGSNAEIHYVSLGASDVTAVGATPITNGYVYLIREGIQQKTGKSVSLSNLGIPGATISDIDNLEVQLLKLDKPDVITLSTGSNDLIAGDDVAGFESDLKGLLGKLQLISPDSLIFIANLPNLVMVERFVKNPDRDVNTANVLEFNQAILRQTTAFDAVLVDLYSVPLNDSLTSEVDGFHPNDRGHRAIADKFLEAIDPLVGEL
jgi:lysophospholipase L1-like esterase